MLPLWGPILVVDAKNHGGMGHSFGHQTDRNAAWNPPRRSRQTQVSPTTSATSAALDDAEALLARVQLEFDEGPGIVPFKFNFKGAIVETSGDYYPGTDASSLFFQLVNDWIDNDDYGLEPDFVHLLSGKNLAPEYGGAGAGNVCPATTYAVAQTTFSSNMLNRGWLTCHLLGLNLDAFFDSCPGGGTCLIMCQNGFLQSGCPSISWSAASAAAVNSAIAKPCYDPASGTVYADSGTSLPFPDGTVELPFASMADAFPHLSSGWTLSLEGGTYNEAPMTLNQPMTLTANDGAAQIK